MGVHPGTMFRYLPLSMQIAIAVTLPFHGMSMGYPHSISHGTYHGMSNGPEMERWWNGGGTAVERWWNGGGTVVARWWNGGGTVVERWWNGDGIMER